MTKADFLNEFNDYIGTLVENDLTDDELKAWIAKESKDYNTPLTETQIEWIIEEVRNRQAN